VKTTAANVETVAVLGRPASTVSVRIPDVLSHPTIALIEPTADTSRLRSFLPEALLFNRYKVQGRLKRESAEWNNELFGDESRVAVSNNQWRLWFPLQGSRGTCPKLSRYD
jgi:hypothetical protein